MLPKPRSCSVCGRRTAGHPGKYGPSCTNTPKSVPISENSSMESGEVNGDIYTVHTTCTETFHTPNATGGRSIQATGESTTNTGTGAEDVRSPAPVTVQQSPAVTQDGPVTVTSSGSSARQLPLSTVASSTNHIVTSAMAPTSYMPAVSYSMASSSGAGHHGQQVPTYQAIAGLSNNSANNFMPTWTTTGLP